MRIIYVFISITLLVGCNSDKEKYISCDNVSTIEGFPIEVNLEPTKPLDINLNGCVEVIHIDSIMIFKTPNASHYWNVYSLEKLTSLGKLLPKGHGHEEFSNMPISELLHRKTNGLMCDFWNPDSKTLYKCNLTQSIAAKQAVYENTSKINVDGDCTGVYQINDSSYFIIQPNLYRGYHRNIYRNGKVEPVSIGNLNEVLVDEDINVVSSINTVNLRHQKVAEAMIRLNQINLYSIGNKDNVTLVIGSQQQSIVSIENQRKYKQRKYFGNMDSNDDYFAALYLDMPLDTYFKGEGKDCSILFFDWNGTPLLKIILPILASGFFIHEEWLYAFVSQEESERLYRYNISSLLHNIERRNVD